ncbi:oligosaccharide flippase family protein [Candidatus Parcubacteria bacterium]|nr:oligosaccharide flippase family protein [Candidatus Parcubacteria bacterium]
MPNSLKQKTYKLLRLSEKWTKTDMVYLAKGGFWLTGSKIVGSFTAFALAIAYANLLPQETYGQYKYILSISSLFGITALTGMDISLARSIINGYEGSLKKVIKIKMKWSLLGLAAGLIVSAYYFINENNTLGISFLFAALFSPLINSIVYSPFLEGRKLFKTLSQYSVISQITVAIFILAVLLIYPNIILIVFAYFFANLLIKFILLIRTYKKYHPNDKEDPKTISFGKHLSFMSVLGLIADQFDKILMWHFLGPAQLAIYSFATIPITQIQSFLKSISIMAFPKISGQDVNITKKTLPIKILKFMVILIAIIIIYILLSTYFYKIFFSGYTDSVKYSWLFSLTLLLFPLRLLAHPLVAKVKQKSLYIINIFGPALKIILLACLLPIYGIWGAIIALLASSIINNLLLYYLFKKI